MKKFGKLLAIVLAVATLGTVLCFSLVACNNKYDYVVGVQSGTTGEYYVKGDEDWGFDGYSNVDTKGYDNGGLAVQAMINNQVDFVVIDEAPAKSLAESAAFSGKIKVINIPLTVEEYAFGVDKAQPALKTQINNLLAQFKLDGTYTAILNKYFNGGTPTGVVSGVLDNTKADQQLVVSTNANFAPFEYKEGGKFYGVDMELAYAIAQELGLELVIADMEFVSVVTSVGNNGVDVAMSGLTIKPDRALVVDFTDSYYNAAQVVICKTDCTLFDSCKTAEDVAKVIANK